MSLLKPKRELNLLQTSAVIIGQVIGSGIFINVPLVAGIVDNIWMSVFVWFLGGLLWIPPILILAEMGTAYPKQGGPYYFIHKAGSPFLAFMYTWTAFLTSDTPTLTIIGLLAADAYVQYRGVKRGANIQVFLTFAKLLPLLAVVVIGVFFFTSGNLQIDSLVKTTKGHPISISMILAGVSATVWAYAGFLNILYTSGEVKNPNRVLPISLIGSVLFVMAAYILISICTGAIVPFDILTSIEEGKFVNPFAYLSVFSEYAGGIFAVAVFVSMLGVMNSSVLTQPRLEYAMAKDGLFFKSFGRLHPKYLTPDFSIIIQSILAIFLLFLGNIGDLLGYFTLSYLLQNTLVFGSIFFLRKKADYNPHFKAPAWLLMAILSIIIQIFIIYGTFTAFPTWGVVSCIILILTGLPLYLFFKRKGQAVD